MNYITENQTGEYFARCPRCNNQVNVTELTALSENVNALSDEAVQGKCKVCYNKKLEQRLGKRPFPKVIDGSERVEEDKTKRYL